MGRFEGGLTRHNPENLPFSVSPSVVNPARVLSKCCQPCQGVVKVLSPLPAWCQSVVNPGKVDVNLPMHSHSGVNPARVTAK